MFMLREASYQLFRHKGRTALMVCVSLLLCGCIAFYLGNISSCETALATINETTPAIVRLTNQGADRIDNLTISYVRYDVLENYGMSKIFATSQARGAISEDLREQFFTNGYGYNSEGDTSLLGVTCREAAGISSDKGFTYADGRDSSLLEGDQGLCLVSEAYAQRFGLTIGDKLSMLVCLVPYGAYGPAYTFPVDVEIEVAGTFGSSVKAESPADIYVPVRWLRAEFQEKAPGVVFNYNSFYAYLADSMSLNQFKEGLRDMGFSQPFQIATFGAYAPYVDPNAGSAVLMDDEDFIKTAEKLGESIRQYKSFLVPFFLVIAGLVTLAIFLVLRGARRDMAVACSLGRPKPAIGAANLLAVLASQAVGCAAALPAMIFAAGISPIAAVQICGAFLLCALVGDLIGLAALLRFDALSLLTKAD